MFLPALSNEIVAEIFRNLSSTHDLLNASYCSRSFSDLAQPYLYSTITLHESNIDGVLVLIRTLLKKPHLIQYVRNFVNKCHNLPKDGVLLSLSEEEQTQIKQEWIVKNSFDPGFTENLNRALFSTPNCNWDAISTLLLLLFSHNLESVSFRWYSSKSWTLWADHDGGLMFPFIKALLKHMKELQVQGKRQSSMSNLHTVSLAGWDIDHSEYISVDELCPFLELPSVSHFNGVIFPPLYDEPEEFNEEYKGKFKLESLNIQCVNFYDDLPSVLELFSELKRFTYGFVDYDYSPYIIMPEHLKLCIEEFNILCFEDDWEDKLGFDHRDDMEQAVSDLRDYPKLSIINMPATILVGTDDQDQRYPEYFCKRSVKNWPDSLEHMTITYCDIKIMDYLCPGFPFGKPNLKTLTFELFKDTEMELDVAKYGPGFQYDAGKQRAVLTRGRRQWKDDPGLR